MKSGAIPLMVVHLTNGGRTSTGMVGAFVFVLLIVFVFDRDTDMVTNFQLHIFVVLGILTGLIMVISELVKRSKLYLLLLLLQHLSLYLLLSFSLPATMLDMASLLPASQHQN